MSKPYHEAIMKELKNSRTVDDRFSIMVFVGKMTRLNVMMLIMELVVQFKSLDPSWPVNPDEVDFWALAEDYLKWKQPWVYPQPNDEE